MRNVRFLVLIAVVYSLPSYSIASTNINAKNVTPKEFTSIAKCLKIDGNYFICNYTSGAATHANANQCVKISKKVYDYLYSNTNVERSDINFGPPTPGAGGNQ